MRNHLGILNRGVSRFGLRKIIQATGCKTYQGRQGPGAEGLRFRQGQRAREDGPETIKSRHLLTDCMWRGGSRKRDLV